MKAHELLKRYATGERNFQRVNLRGQSFKRQDLSGANFSEADIQSANFTGANLKGANFTDAKCGLQKSWERFLTILFWPLAVISGFCSIFTAGLISLIFYPSSREELIAGWISLIVLVLFLIITIWQGILRAAVVVALTIVVTVAVAVAVPGGTAVAAAVLLPGIGAVGGVLVGTVAVAVTIAILETREVTKAFAIVGIGAIIGAFAVLGLTTVTGENAVLEIRDVAIALIGAVAVVAVSLFLAWRALKEDKRDAWARSFAVYFSATGGTSFYRADLTEANFTRARLKSTDLRKANLTRVSWAEAKMLDRVRTGDDKLKNPSERELLTKKRKKRDNDK